MGLKPVAPPTKAAAAFEQLREAIQSGDLMPGTRITLNDVAAELGMSLTPVREALRLLASQGLVTYRPHYGTVVADHDWSRAEEIYELRLTLEPMATRKAGTLAAPEDVAALTEAQAEADSAIERGDLHLLPELNWRFHTILYAIARSTYLQEFIDRLWSGLPYQAISLTDRARKSSQEHHDILAALQVGDADLAGECMHRHITAAAHQALKVLDARAAEAKGPAQNWSDRARR